MEKEKFDIEAFPTSESALCMLGNVTQGFYDKSYVGKWLYQVMGLEYDETKNLVEELPLQMFPETATWGLMYHEIKWQLPIRENLSYEERRRLIYQKRDYRVPMTPYRMEKYLEDVTGFEVRIADVNNPGEYGFVAPHPNVFRAYFIGDGTLDSKKVHEILNRLKQSHTTYGINERIEVVFDNRKLEQIILRNVRFKMQISFWYKYVYDGTWLLDGSVILGVKRRYGLVLGLKYKQGTFYTPEQMKPISVEFTTRVKHSELVHSKSRHNFGINFWGVRCFDGSWTLDEAMCLNGKRKYGLLVSTQSSYEVVNRKEIINNIIVETKTRDYWFLNGILPLNGSKKLNSICRRERIE